eukprot:GHVR01108078.1.p1 GENE.GHVR01108078.1~~GHVR01108078.1.p1  ORF type:complete len:232 (-),score=55.89 GHVR01108078.1:424-1119(-)
MKENIRTFTNRNDHNVSGYFISAIVASSITKIFCAPLDRVRILYQLQGSWTIQKGKQNLKYGTLIDTCKIIIREEGIKGLWKGTCANIIRAAAIYTTKFGTNDAIKDFMLNNNENNNKTKKKKIIVENNKIFINERKLSIKELAIAGIGAGTVQKLFTYPLDLLYIRVSMGINMNEINKKQYLSIRECIYRIFHTEGIKGFYKGLTPTVITGIPYVTLQMMFFELFRRHYK